MKRIFFLAAVVVFAAACETKPKYDPLTYLDASEKEKVHLAVVREIGKIPEKANDSTRHSKVYDDYYRELASKHQLKHYFIAENGEHFFLEWRPAPSLQQKFVATGGKLRLDEDGKLVAFEEVFRTWKMQPDTLARRGLLLFDRMVKGESLSQFETINSKGVEFIEFPDENVFYDTVSGQWKSKQFESVEEMVKEGQ